MTVAEIRTLAAGLGYGLSGSLKADIIAGFLAAQEVG